MHQGLVCIMFASCMFYAEGQLSFIVMPSCRHAVLSGLWRCLQVLCTQWTTIRRNSPWACGLARPWQTHGSDARTRVPKVHQAKQRWKRDGANAVPVHQPYFLVAPRLSDTNKPELALPCFATRFFATVRASERRAAKLSSRDRAWAARLLDVSPRRQQLAMATMFPPQQWERSSLFLCFTLALLLGAS